MVKEIELLPEVTKSLTNFDPTKFRPDWKASGRRWRVDKAAKLQYATKGLVEKDLFRVPKVPSGMYFHHCINIFDDSASTFLTILHQHFLRFCINISDDSASTFLTILAL